ncbi:MAG: FCD domain-containing protein, partial [Planctomycetes bacterium]|nr:FCD domain-containing protein [Planctomycetota bacterium]
ANFCRNLPMKVTIRKCWSYERLSYKLLDQGLDSMKTQYEQHRSILLAVADGDANRARKEMANHLKDVRILRDSRPAD